MAKKKKVDDGAVSVADHDEIFDLSLAGQAIKNMPHYKRYYTEVMEGKKNLKGKVVEMSPKEFLAKIDTTNYDASGVKGLIQDGKKLAIPVWDRVRNVRIGIEAAVACDELKIESIPVLLCE